MPPSFPVISTVLSRVRPVILRWGAAWASAAVAVSLAGQAPELVPATTPPTASTWTLRTLFEHAWQRQPQAQAYTLHQQAAQATQRAAQRWTAQAPAVEVKNRTDRPGSGQGLRETEVALILPLWLPHERQRSSALSDAQSALLQRQQQAAQWQLAGQVRQTWWDWQRARSDAALAQAQLYSARRLAQDVQRRFEAGDLARSDALQAQAVVIQAHSAQLQAHSAQQAARAALSVWLAPDAPKLPDLPDLPNLPNLPEASELELEPLAAEPPVPAHLLPFDGNSVLDRAHPTLAHSQAQKELAHSSAELAAVQRHANPELTLAATRARDQAGERYRQSFTLGLRVPLGWSDTAQAKEASARAQALEAEIGLQRERERLAQDLRAAQARATSAQAQSEAAASYAALVRDTLALVDKAFRAGQVDWPTRWRIEQDAAQAARQQARARMDAAAAVSALRQALGLLPE